MNLTTLYPILFWLWIATEVLAVLLTHTRRSTGETRDRGSLLVLWPTIYCSTWGCMRYGATHPHTIFGGVHWLVPLSFALFTLGMALRWASILSLGRSFSVNVAIHATQTLKTNGLYRFARHPSYTSMLIIFLAIGLQTRNWIALAIMMVPTTLALLYRIHVEEAALLHAFGEEYASYSHTTSRLIPGIY